MDDKRIAELRGHLDNPELSMTRYWVRAIIECLDAIEELKGLLDGERLWIKEGKKLHDGQKEEIERLRTSFVAVYAYRSKTTPEFLKNAGQVAVRCECGEPGCVGWQMVDEKAIDDKPSGGIFSPEGELVIPLKSKPFITMRLN